MVSYRFSNVLQWFSPSNSTTSWIFIVVFVLWVFFLLTLDWKKVDISFKSIQSLTSLTSFMRKLFLRPLLMDIGRLGANKYFSWFNCVCNIRKAEQNTFFQEEVSEVQLCNMHILVSVKNHLIWNVGSSFIRTSKNTFGIENKCEAEQICFLIIWNTLKYFEILWNMEYVQSWAESVGEDLLSQNLCLMNIFISVYSEFVFRQTIFILNRIQQWLTVTKARGYW